MLSIVCLYSPATLAFASANAPDQKSLDSTDCCSVERVDDIWLISTRHLGCPAWDKSSDVDLRVKHYSVVDGWSESSLSEFLASDDPTQPTLIYVHGNRVGWCDAIQGGRNAYEDLLGCSPSRPVRYVIWSWPSDQIHGQLKDVRVKAARTNGEGYYLAWLLGQLDPATPVSLLGYSFGARIATGALHLLGGGELAGRALSPVLQRPSSSIRVALIAAAVHNHWLHPGGCHDQALSQMERLLIQYNSCDPVLKRYRLIEKRSRPAALGYTGMYVSDELATWIEQRDVCCIVGKSHDEDRYLSSASLTAQMRLTLLDE